MYEELGRMIREARERLGLEQYELATQIGVGQQAVSTWERGRSRPRQANVRRVGEVLRLDETALLEAGGYRTPSPSATQVVPLARFLPVDELPPERFEDFVAALIKTLHPESHVTLYGGPGEDQAGIDILVAGDDGTVATAQCKRHRTFGPAAVSAAVAEVSIEAPRHYLFLARRTATTGARDEMARYPSWQLWDGTDIARHLQNRLTPDQAVRIVDTYFPGHRESFLGIPEPGPWLPAEEVFAASEYAIFTHQWTLAGRVEELDRLKTTVYDSSRGVAILCGRGGIGKTRLLREIAESAPTGHQVRLLQGDAPVSPSDFELLPADQPLTVLIDDGHDRSDLSNVVAGIRARNAEATILVATRSYGLNGLKTSLVRATGATEDATIVRLDELARLDAEALAREALGGTHEAVVQRLAEVTKDCPLTTVVGGVLIRRGSLDFDAIPSDDAVREAILRGFRDALVSDPLVVDADTRSAVLDAIAALQPFRSSEQPFREALSELVGKPYDALNRHLRSLEEAGILQRRGDSLRIVPDLLGDVILVDACYDANSNTETGYLDRVRKAVTGAALQHLFINASRVDWQIRRSNTGSPSLVDELWAPIDEEIKAADIGGREQLVKLLTKVAFFQPDRVLAIARWLIDNPTDQTSEMYEGPFAQYRPTYREVLNALPDVLKVAAYTFDALPEAAAMLWELAQTDTRATNNHTSHPLRILGELAELEIGKPLVYNERILDVASGWFADGQTLSPFTVLEPLFATEGTRSTYQDYAIRFQPFSMNITGVAPLRGRLIDLAFEEARSSDLHRALAGIQALESGLRYPMGMHGRPVSPEEKDGWTPEFQSTIRRLGEFAQRPLIDPVVGVAIRKTLHWHSSYSQTDTSGVAQEAIDKLPDGLEDQLALIIHDGWGGLIRDREDDYEVAEQKVEERLVRAVGEMSSLSDEQVVEVLDRRLSREQQAFGSSGASYPGPLIGKLIEERPTLAPLLIDLIEGGSHPVLEPMLPIVLAVCAEADAGPTLGRARQLWDQNPSAEIKRGIAQAFGLNRGIRPVGRDELALLLTFAADDDVLVKSAAVRAAQRIAKAQPAEAIQLIMAVDFTASAELADEVFVCFNDQHYGLAWRMLSRSQKATLRARLLSLPAIDKFWTTSFLSEISATDPRWVIGLFQDRIIHAEGLDELDGYQPMPWHWDARLRVREHSSFVGELEQLQAWIAEAPESYRRQEYGSELFQAVAGTYDDTVLQVLSKALADGGEADIAAVAGLIRKSQGSLAWGNPAFVAEALHAADHFGIEARQTMGSAFWAATLQGGRSGTIGEPFPEDVQQRDRCTAIADLLAKGSIEEEFYRSMVRAAEENIARSAIDDVRTDGRDW